MIAYDRTLGAFRLSDDQASDAEVCARLNRALTEIRRWLEVKRRRGRFGSGFLVELALNSEAPHFHIHAVFDEIGKLEGTDPTPSGTKKSREMHNSLRGLWHKHYFQPSFLPHNLLNELDRMEKDGRWEALWAPHYGKYVHEIAGKIVHELTVSAFERRSQDRKLTGEFIVFEKKADGSNYYLTLGTHGEWDAIRQRVDAYKRFDGDEG